MLIKDEGVVLRSSKSGGSSKIITFLGKTSGKIKLIAKGAFKKDSAFRGSLESGQIVEVLYYFKDQRDIYFLREVTVLHTDTGKNGSLAQMASTLAALELVDHVYYAGAPGPDFLDVLVTFLEVDKTGDPLFLFLALELKLLHILGALPEFGLCSVCGGAVKGGFYDAKNGVSYCSDHVVSTAGLIPLSEEVIAVLEKSRTMSMPDIARIKIDESLRKNFGLILHWTYTHHVQGYRLPNALKLLG